MASLQQTSLLDEDNITALISEKDSKSTNGLYQKINSKSIFATRTSLNVLTEILNTGNFVLFVA